MGLWMSHHYAIVHWARAGLAYSFASKGAETSSSSLFLRFFWMMQCMCRQVICSGTHYRPRNCQYLTDGNP